MFSKELSTAQFCALLKNSNYKASNGIYWSKSFGMEIKIYRSVR